MANAVLPATFVQAVVREIFRDELINPTQSYFLVWSLFDSHRDEGHVRVWRLWEGFLLAKENSCAMAV